MSERIGSGNQGLDTVLGGGLPANAINLITGLPGTGKTLLAQQCVFHNVTEGFPVVYISTTSEPFEKILRYGEKLSFFNPARIGHGLIYEDLGITLLHHGLDAARQKINELIRHHRPGLCVIDSFKALSSHAASVKEFRDFLYELAAILSAFPVTTLWLGEYSADDMATAPEFAVADTIIELSSHSNQQRSARGLQVLKLRGSAFLSGRHAYRLDADGLTVYPRLADPVATNHCHRQQERMSSGIQALDAMLDQGYRSGSSTLIVGPTGIGKTGMGLHFLFRGAAEDEPGVLANFQEDPTQLDQMVRGFGWSLPNDNVTLLYRSPVDLYIDQWVYELLDAVESTGASRVFIDSLNNLEATTDEPQRFTEYLYSLLIRLSRRNISTMMSYEVLELFGLSQLSEQAVSNIADNVVLLQYDSQASTITRSLTVLKTRASTHAPGIHSYEITPNGITLTDTPPTTQPAQTP
jgi:circadian clock protein KaiC